VKAGAEPERLEVVVHTYSLPVFGGAGEQGLARSATNVKNAAGVSWDIRQDAPWVICRARQCEFGQMILGRITGHVSAVRCSDYTAAGYDSCILNGRVYVRNMEPIVVVAVFGVDPFRIGGVEIYTRELARQLEARQIGLVAVFSKKPQGAVADFLTAPNLSVEEIPALEDSALRAIPELASILKKYRARILHLQFVNFVGLFPWVAKLCGVGQVFFTAQGSEPAGYRLRRSQFWKRMLVRVVNAPVNRVFCISDYVRRALATRDLLPAERFRVVYNAILPPSLDQTALQGRRFRQTYGIPEDCLLVTQVSWIIPEKGIPQLLEAARIVLNEFPQVRFAIVGSGSHEKAYRQRAEELGIASSLLWTGVVQNPMEDGVYAATDIFCLASQWEEAFGWVIAEAMAFGKPVVASAVGGIPEVVEDGVTGFLVSPCTDSALLARQILRLLRASSEERQLMGAAGRRAVEQKFHLQHTVAQIVSEYGL
jgi:glycosyltransferase involved in cell wall biosynthesis